MDIVLTLASVAAWQACIPVFLKYRRYPAALKCISWYVLLGGAAETVSWTLWYYKANNIWMFHLYFPSTCIVLLAFYRNVLKDIFSRSACRILIVAVLAGSAINTIAVQKFTHFNSYTIIAVGILITFFALLYFKRTLVSTQRRTGSGGWPAFWVNAGLLLYYSGSLLTLCMSNIIASFAYILRIRLWSLHAFFLILMYSLITIGLWTDQAK